MFAKTKAFSSFAVDDLAKVKSFYSQTLGIPVDESDGVLMLHIAGDRDVMIYPKPDYIPATYTVLNFPVEDVDAAVDELSSRGVTFVRYEGFDQDEKGISRAMGVAIAWFADPAGNILAVLRQ